MSYLLFTVALLALIYGANAVDKFDLVQSDNDRMILNYNVTLGVNGTYCVNVSSYAISSISPTVTVSLISSNPNHKIYDASFTFFPARQVIGGVSGFSIYKNATVIARYPEPEWSRQYNFCKATTLDTPTLKPFDEICIGNTCGSGTCPGTFNRFSGQIEISGYETNDVLARNPVPSSCGRQSVGEVQYVAYTEEGSTVFNYEVTVNQSKICSPVFAATYLNNKQTVGVTTNFTAANGANLGNFAVDFVYPSGSVVTLGKGDWPLSGAQSDDTTCNDVTVWSKSGVALQTALPAGFTQVCIGSDCSGNANCSYETFTGSLIVHGMWADSYRDWIGTIDQSCYLVINAPTHAPTKDPPVTRGDVAAIILASTIGSVLFVYFVWTLVVGFRRLKRRYIVGDGKELHDPGCTWAGW
mmetsp:Transcript_29805/g.32457  ORF Transcript_29805/g.32457 Transcript_29805/m.32457 type:complete len:413 (-) Transcript_29805:326-1564(-)|eukprot:CAMPEP_0173163184 /NCGR_PEP_ID=MMETSP1105-20130129/19772_1 /TAXON_ID=2985 /ORGANISM="Ochromonas sp., Strain BG-1" /LENGTH=412 /DNA_ID=CAMNT_0014083197 /DNA_START=90 /DNA_END=1328 /DNA_ORIENTATION=+